MNNVKNYKYHKTGQFRDAIRNVLDKSQFKGIDDNGKAIIDPTIRAPKIKYTGLVKLHGTNASIIAHNDGIISFHSKSQLLGYINGEDFTLISDNAGFAQSMWDRKEAVYELVELAEMYVSQKRGGAKYPVKISGEWCGPGIQKGAGITNLKNKSLFIFGILDGEGDLSRWMLPRFNLSLENSGIYNLLRFKTFDLTIDFNNPSDHLEFLTKVVEEVEKECPVSKLLMIESRLMHEENLIGEGVVWIPEDDDFNGSGFWFKTKGQKHSSSKVKKVTSISPEVLKNIREFVEYSVTDNRLEQGLVEIGLDKSKVGVFIGWVNRDIHSEEKDTLEASGLTMKDVGKDISNKARSFYLEKLYREQNNGNNN